MDNNTQVSKYCQGEKCWCGADAAQKIEQVIFDDMPPVHPYTAYVCPLHFSTQMHGSQIIAQLELSIELLKKRRPDVAGLGAPIQLLQDVITTLREQ